MPRRLTVAAVPCHTAKARREQCPLTVAVGLHLMVVALAPPAVSVEAEAAFLPHPAMAAEAVEDMPAVEGTTAGTAKIHCDI
jgi:hypothetical protein